MGRLTRPTFHTERLRLEPLGGEHTDALVELDSDPEVLRHIFGRALTRDEVVRDWLPKRTRPDADARGLGYWAGFVDDEFVGWWCLGIDDADHDAAELGYRLRRTAWGRGLATEGSHPLLDHAFVTLGLQRVWAETVSGNTGSQRVMAKLGLTRVRTYLGEWDDPHPDRRASVYVYATTASQHRG